MNGSLDSMDKSQFNSSLEEDTQSFDIYEAHNPNAATVSTDRGKNNYVDLAYQNQGTLNFFIYFKNFLPIPLRYASYSPTPKVLSEIFQNIDEFSEFSQSL